MKRQPWIIIALVASLAANATLGGMLLSGSLLSGSLLSGSLLSGTPPSGSVPGGRPAAGREPASRGWQNSFLSRHLKLDPGQVEALDALHRDLGRGLAPTRLELSERRREMIVLLRQPQPDQIRLDELSRQMAELQAAMEKAYARNFLEVKEILTPEQQALYFELLLRKLAFRNDVSREPEPSDTEQ